MEKIFNWNFTKCKAIHSIGKRKRKLYYNFYIVDYEFPDSSIDSKDHIIEMRNKGIVKTKYFHIEKKAKDFINNITK